MMINTFNCCVSLECPRHQSIRGLEFTFKKLKISLNIRAKLCYLSKYVCGCFMQEGRRQHPCICALRTVPYTPLSPTDVRTPPNNLYYGNLCNKTRQPYQRGPKDAIQLRRSGFLQLRNHCRRDMASTWYIYTLRRRLKCTIDFTPRSSFARRSFSSSSSDYEETQRLPHLSQDDPRRVIWLPAVVVCHAQTLFVCIDV